MKILIESIIIRKNIQLNTIKYVPIPMYPNLITVLKWT